MLCPRINAFPVLCPVETQLDRPHEQPAQMGIPVGTNHGCQWAAGSAAGRFRSNRAAQLSFISHSSMGSVDFTRCMPTSEKRLKAASASAVKSTTPGTTTGEVQSSNR